MALKQHLAEDETDEREAISNYGERQEEAREHPALKSALRGIQSDERRHARTLKAHRTRLSRSNAGRKTGR